MKRYRFVPPGGGPNYDWSRDNTFVKVSGADTGGAFALMEDNLKREFALGLQLHTTSSIWAACRRAGERRGWLAFFHLIRII
jgi:hypothetical protein